MTFSAPSFFVGVGTVLGILALGFGGGVLMSDVISDKNPREPSKVERRAAEIAKPAPAETTAAPAVSAPAPQPTVAAPQIAEPPPQPPQVEQANSQPQAPPQAQQAETQPAPLPQVRRVDLPQQLEQPIREAKPRPEQQPNAPSRAIVRRVPLGPEQPVALVNPAQQAQQLQQKKQQAQQLQQKKQQQRKLAEQRRQQQQQIKQAQELKAAAERSKPAEVDDDDEHAERPVFLRPERAEPRGRSFFRLFSDDD